VNLPLFFHFILNLQKLTNIVNGVHDPDYFWNKMKAEIFNEILMKISRNTEIQQYLIYINEIIVKRL
jgi:hypothetical protein